jgi:hypothetical protein
MHGLPGPAFNSLIEAMAEVIDYPGDPLRTWLLGLEMTVRRRGIVQRVGAVDEDVECAVIDPLQHLRRLARGETDELRVTGPRPCSLGLGRFGGATGVAR